MRALVLGIVATAFGAATVWAALHPEPFSSGISTGIERSAGPIENLVVLPQDAGLKSEQELIAGSGLEIVPEARVVDRLVQQNRPVYFGPARAQK